MINFTLQERGPPAGYLQLIVSYLAELLDSCFLITICISSCKRNASSYIKLKLQHCTRNFVVAKWSGFIASGVRNTDQSSFKCSAVQVLHQDIESFNTNKPVLFHA